MRLGILADVHANEDALRAVLADGAQDVDRWYCLGDVVGRGPFPIETLLLLREHVDAQHWLFGNHDAYVIGLRPYPAENTTDPIVWDDHRRQIEAHTAGRGRWSLRRWCRQMWQPHRADPRCIKTTSADCWLVHAALGSWILNIGDTKYSYILPFNTTENQVLMEEQFKHLRQRQRDGRPVVLIHGHTHVPYVAFRSWDLDRPVLLPIRYDRPQPLGAFDAMLICPGSVGLPRNCDTAMPVHAAYGILDTKASTFEFRRVRYDSERTWLAMGGRGYPTRLIEIMKGSYVAAEQQNNHDECLRWRQTYRAQPWGWEPVLDGAPDRRTSSGGKDEV